MAGTKNPHNGIRVPFTLPLYNAANLATKVQFDLGAIHGGPNLLRVYLRLPFEHTHVLVLETHTGRFTLPPRADTDRHEDDGVLYALRTLLATDAGHRYFTDSVLSLDTLAVTNGYDRSEVFRNAQVTAWAIANQAPDWIRDALYDAALTCEGPIADLGQAFLTASGTSPEPARPHACSEPPSVPPERAPAGSSVGGGGA